MTALAAGGLLALAGDISIDTLTSQELLSNTASAQQDGEDGGRGRDGRGGRGGRGGEGRGGEGGPPGGMQDGGRGGRGGEGRGGRGGEGGRGGGRGGFGGMRDIRELLEPDFQRRDVPLFVEQLQLDESQRPIVEALIFDYEDAFQEGSQAAQGEMMDMGRQMMQAFMGSGDGGNDMRTRMRENFQNIRDEIDEIEAAQGEMSEEDRRAMFRERMREAAEEQMSMAQEDGSMDTARAIMSDMLDVLEQWISERQMLHDRLVEDVKVQLTDDQLVQWPAFDRFLVREKTLPRGRLSGESVNLFLVLDDIGMSDDAFGAVEEHLDEYEVRLHESLKARNKFLLSSSTELYRAMRDGDSDAARRVLERQVRYREAVRNVNDDFRAIFVNAIQNEEERTVVKAAILAAAYERIYRDTSGQRAFESARGLEDLSEDQLEAVTDLEMAFLIELASRNNQLMGLSRKTEAKDQVERGERMVAMMSGDMSRGMPWFGRGDDGEDEYRSAMDRRDDLDESYRERLNALLTPEQQKPCLAVASAVAAAGVVA